MQRKIYRFAKNKNKYKEVYVFIIKSLTFYDEKNINRRTRPF